MLLAPLRDPFVVVAVGDRPAHCQKQQLGQRIGHTMRLACVLDRRKVLKQRPQPRLLTKTTC